MDGSQIVAAAGAAQDAASVAVAGDPRTELVMALGRAYHQSGVPSDQLEALMHGAALALGIELQVTVLPTSITAASGPALAQRVVLLRLEPGAVDFRRLSLLNAVLAEIVARDVAPLAALARVNALVERPEPLAPLVGIAAYGALSTGVAIMLGGHAREAIVASVIGLAVGIVWVIGQRVPAVDRLFEVFAGFLSTVIVTFYANEIGPVAVYVPIVAGVVQVLPGFSLTTALHELASRNLVAGTARLGSVLMTLLSLGCGFALGIAVVGPSALHVEKIAYSITPWYVIALGVLGIAVGIAVLERARLADVPWVFGSCGIAEIAYRLFASSPAFQVATFGAALVVGILANVGARFVRLPQAVLLIPGILIIVPGALSYESILFLLQNNAADAATIAANASIAAVEIVAGLLLSELIVAPVRRAV